MSGNRRLLLSGKSISLAEGRARTRRLIGGEKLFLVRVKKINFCSGANPLIEVQGVFDPVAGKLDRFAHEVEMVSPRLVIIICRARARTGVVNAFVLENYFIPDAGLLCK